MKDDTITIEKAREILRTEADFMSDEEIRDLIIYFEEMADNVITDYEIKKFGKPPKQLLT